MADTFLIKKVGLTEKASIMQQNGKYMFFVEKDATKPEIKKAIEALYRVEVKDVNVLRGQGKMKRFRNIKSGRPEYKKAIVTLKPGQKIDVLGTK